MLYVFDMKKIHLILLFLLAIFLMPAKLLACGKDSKKSCCKTENVNTSCKMKCCQKKSDKKSDDGCDGKCGKNTCQIQSFSFGAILPIVSELHLKTLVVSTLKQSFFSNETDISSGFVFIWSPPNIS